MFQALIGGILCINHFQTELTIKLQSHPATSKHQANTGEISQEREEREETRRVSCPDILPGNNIQTEIH